MEEPSRATTPTRAPIEVLSDERTAPRLASAAVTRSLTRGARGPLILAGSLLLGVIVTLAYRSPLLGVVLALWPLLIHLVAMLRRARLAFRRAAPAGHRLTSCYDDEGRLLLTTGIGTRGLFPGSVDRVERRNGLVYLRIVPERRWIVLPAGLVTNEDARYLLRRSSLPTRTPVGVGPTVATADLEAPGARHGAHDDLPLMHVVTPESRRNLQAAIAGQVLSSRDGRVQLTSLLLMAVLTAWVRDWVNGAMLGLAAAAVAGSVVAPVLAVRRRHPLGHLIRAAVSPTHLVVRERDNISRYPWSSVRSCTTTRRAVVLALVSGVALPLPRSLFPAADLARLQQLVHAPRSPIGELTPGRQRG